MSDPTARPTPAPAPPAADDAPRPVVYRPLSVLAVVGAGLSGLFTAIVVLGGLVAFFRGDPWLLNAWWALLPITGGALSALGLVQIQRSEGTLAGEKVARWGLLLSVLVGLSYWAYVGVTYFAIGREAEQFGKTFLTKVAQGELPSAFRLALPPDQRPPDDAELRPVLERRFNGLSETNRKGPLTTFSQAEFVRIIRVGGPETTIEPIGVEDWKYLGGGYQVRLLYQVNTTLTNFVMDLTIQGKEGKGSKGRDWYVVWDKCGMRRDPPPHLSDEGKSLFTLAGDVPQQVMTYWLRPMAEHKAEDLYLQTLLPAQREQARKRADEWRLGLLLADAVGAGALPCADPAAVLGRVALGADAEAARLASLGPGLDEFRAGTKFVRAPEGVYWAPEEIRAEIVKLARAEFRHPSELLATQFMPDPSARMPFIRRQGDRVVFEQDATLRLPSEAPRYAVDCRLLIDCDAAEATSGTVKSWRVVGLDLVSGKSLPLGRPTMGPGGPGGPGGPSPMGPGGGPPMR